MIEKIIEILKDVPVQFRNRISEVSGYFTDEEQEELRKVFPTVNIEKIPHLCPVCEKNYVTPPGKFCSKNCFYNRNK